MRFGVTIWRRRHGGSGMIAIVHAELFSKILALFQGANASAASAHLFRASFHRIDAQPSGEITE